MTADDQARKSFATACATAAMHGYQLRRVIEPNGHEAYLVLKWTFWREFADLPAAEQFVNRAIGANR